MKNLNSNAKQIKIKKEQLAERIAQEKQIIREIIMSREYTQKELEAIIFYLEKGKKEQAKKILTKGCFCQKTTKT
jgi:phage antirepressor YoqD-like protein